MSRSARTSEASGRAPTPPTRAFYNLRAESCFYELEHASVAVRLKAQRAVKTEPPPLRYTIFEQTCGRRGLVSGSPELVERPPPRHAEASATTKSRTSGQLLVLFVQNGLRRGLRAGAAQLSSTPHFVGAENSYGTVFGSRPTCFAVLLSRALSAPFSPLACIFHSIMLPRGATSAANSSGSLLFSRAARRRRLFEQVFL